jgi:transposase
MENLKYSVGIDIAKLDFKACISVINSSQKVIVRSTKTFNNTQKGFEEFEQWVSKNKKEDLPLYFLMEATGIYHEQLAWFLHYKGYNVTIILPNKAKKYLQSLGLKSKNDKIDAKGLAQMCAEQSLPLWSPISKNIYKLRSLTRLHEDLTLQKTASISRFKGLEYTMYELKEVKKITEKMLKVLEKELDNIEKLIKQTIDEDTVLKSKYEKISIIKGVGLMTFAVVVAETNGFELFSSIAQLTSYAGYDVTERQSGTIKGKTRISKKGNTHLRRVLHMPAFNVVKYEPIFKKFFDNVYTNTSYSDFTICHIDNINLQG